MDQIQQGDVLIQRVDRIPTHAKASKPGKRGYVLAEGEATGHAHRVAADGIRMYEIDGTLYMAVDDKPATVTHEEHGPVTVPPGRWQIKRVREYDYLDQMARPVED